MMRRNIETLARLLANELDGDASLTILACAEKYQETTDRINDALDVLKIVMGHPTILPPVDWSILTAARRAEAAMNPYRWRIGGSPFTNGHTFYQGNRLIGMILDPDDARDIVAAMNALEGQAPPGPEPRPGGIRF